MTTIPENYIHEQAVNKSIAAFFKEYGIGKHFKKVNAYKSKGIPAIRIFIYMIQLVFTKKSMYMNILNGTHNEGFSKDVVYRLMNATYINWTMLLLYISSMVVKRLDGLTDEKRLNALVIDDTIYERKRSKKVELLANVHDHAAKGKDKYKRGFRLLTLAWTDGTTTIPLHYRHLSSSEPKNRYAEARTGMDKRTIGYKIRQQAQTKATDILLAMLKQAKKANIPVKHVVFDTWFAYPSTMMNIKETGYETIGRLKDTTKIMYLVDGKKQTLKQIYAAHKKRRGRAKYLLSVEAKLYNDKDETLPARIVFVRDRNNRKKWIAFACTDMALSEEEIIKLYGKRWDIEVFFKICKSYLNLSREFYGMSYDAMTAHTAVVMMRYVILAVHKRQNEDPRSLGELFFLMYDEVADMKFADVLALMLDMLHKALDGCFSLTDEQINMINDRFLTNLSGYFNDLLVRNKSCA